jgi:neutral amino acid transport system ATP-binding protein
VSLLCCQELTKRFGGIVALDGCSLEVPEGEIVGLIGPNGSGKTTLFNVVTGFVRPDRGEVLFDQERITGLAPDEVFRRGIGRTFQLPRIFPRLTVMENLLLPAARFREQRSAENGASSRYEHALVLLDLLGLAGHASRPAGRLSYGQRKLLELGIVMMGKPYLVLLDEPAGGVNPALLEVIAARIVELNRRGTTFLIVEHNLSFVMDLCRQVVVLDRGRPVASGTPSQVREDPVVLEAYLGS